MNIFDGNNQEVAEFNAGVSPGTLAFDVRSSAHLNELSGNLEVYPNPFTDHLTVNLSGEKRLMDAQGKTMFVAEDYTIDVSGLSPGIYWLNCQGVVLKTVKY